MVPFLPLHRNREHFISSRELGYEYSNLLDARESGSPTAIFFYFQHGANLVNFVSFPDQRLAESMRPYLEELQDLWPWLLLAGVCGGIVSAATAAALLMAKRRLPRLPAGTWKTVLPERLPLLWDRDDRENYQTAI